jgi:hypothetical protein
VSEFVFMLTHHDQTVARPLDVLGQVRDCGLRYVGFKDVGAEVPVLTEVCAAAHGFGMQVMLEVVSTSREDELASIAAACEIGVDWLLGGTHAHDGLAVLAQVAISKRPLYCPFPGTVVGHPSVLLGEIAEIAASAAELTAIDGVHGLDLLAYRHPTADVAALTRAVVRAAAGPVIAAGSVASTEQIRVLSAAGAWGFTIGGAIFEGRLPGGPSVPAQVEAVLAAAAGYASQGTSA